jgi:hypothetical protein
MSDSGDQNDVEEAFRVRLDRLEQDNLEARQHSEQRILLAEMKVEAIRAGMIDLDGLQFLDLTQVHLEDTGGIVGGVELIGQLKRTKPWLFLAPSSSSTAKVPPSKPSRQKLATEMTDEEYRIARTNIIKRPTF